MKKTNFDRYLEDQIQDSKFAVRFERAGKVWEVKDTGRRVMAEAAAPYRVKRASAKRPRRSVA